MNLIGFHSKGYLWKIDWRVKMGLEFDSYFMKYFLYNGRM